MPRRSIPLIVLAFVSVMLAGPAFAEPGPAAPQASEGTGVAAAAPAPGIAQEVSAATTPVTVVPALTAPPVITSSPPSTPTVTPAMLHVASTSAPAGTASASGAGPETGYAVADRIVVHKAQRRLDLMLRGRVIASYPVRLGLNPVGHKEREGDFRTPEGTYQLTRRNQYSDFFLSIGVSYPNDGDRRRAKQQRVAPGGAIMIHGQPNFPRKPADYYAMNDWTDGCIAVSNSDMVDIWLRTRIGLPIEIRP